MKKALIATAVASAIGMPAMAQQVTLSGRASMEVGNWKATGSAAGSASDFKNRTRVADTGSRFTFAVSEDLGGGMRAGVYCETGINIDNGGSTDQAGSNNANTSDWCSREGRAFIGSSGLYVSWVGRHHCHSCLGRLRRLHHPW
jgi:predicted porin